MSSKQLYSADEVAELLGLHVRTVRGYVRDGRLPAVRIGKQYRIAHEDLEKLTGGRLVAVDAAPKRIDVTSIIQIDGADRTTESRLAALVSGAVAGGPHGDPRLHTETVYDPGRRSLKMLIVGGPDDTAALLRLVAAFDVAT